MKIYIPQRAKTGIGGGFRFTENITETLKNKVQFTDNWQGCDIYFIPGATLSQRDEVLEAKDKGKKIVLRIDNALRNSRNRNTGMSRMFDFSQIADVVIYQSQWAKNFLMPFTKRDGEVILNGVNTDIFKPEGERLEKDGSPQFLYVRVNRDETKRWERAWYDFQKIYFNNPKAHLWIVGRFSPTNIEYNFDFFGGAENRYKFFGVIDSSIEMAKIYRSADLMLCPYSNDACSNVVAEAMACRLSVSRFVADCGGIDEQIEKGVVSLEEMGKQYLKVFIKVVNKQ